jgi:predicted oxidoreductase
MINQNTVNKLIEQAVKMGMTKFSEFEIVYSDKVFCSSVYNGIITIKMDTESNMIKSLCHELGHCIDFQTVTGYEFTQDYINSVSYSYLEDRADYFKGLLLASL